MKDVFALFQKALKIVCKLGYIDLGCFGIGTVCHSLIETVKRNRLAEIVEILLTI